MGDHNPFDLPAQAKELADKAELERLVREQEEDDFKWLMSSRRGRRIVWKQLERAGIFRSSFDTNSMRMAFAEGSRNDGVRTLALIHTLCPDLYPVMVREATNHDNRSSNDSAGRNDP